MQINHEQIETIRKLVNRAATFEAMQGQLECTNEECGQLHDYEGIDDGALTELHSLASEVERILDAAPLLSSEIELVSLEEELREAIIADCLA